VRRAAAARRCRGRCRGRWRRAAASRATSCPPPRCAACKPRRCSSAASSAPSRTPSSRARRGDSSSAFRRRSAVKRTASRTSGAQGRRRSVAQAQRGVVRARELRAWTNASYPAARRVGRTLHCTPARASFPKASAILQEDERQHGLLAEDRTLSSEKRAW